MIEKLLAGILTQPLRLAEQELRRLEEGGYLDAEEVERLLAEAKERLGGQAARARSFAQPLLEAAGGAFRDALDIPTRAEIRELTEALREAREARPGD